MSRDTKKAKMLTYPDGSWMKLPWLTREQIDSNYEARKQKVLDAGWDDVLYYRAQMPVQDSVEDTIDTMLNQEQVPPPFLRADDDRSMFDIPEGVTHYGIPTYFAALLSRDEIPEFLREAVPDVVVIHILVPVKRHDVQEA